MEAKPPLRRPFEINFPHRVGAAAIAANLEVPKSYKSIIVPVG